MKAYHSYIVTSDKFCVGATAQLEWQEPLSKEEGDAGMVHHFLGIRFILVFSAGHAVSAYHYDNNFQKYVLCDPLYLLSEGEQKVLASLLSPWYVKFHMIDGEISEGKVPEIEIPPVDLSVLH